MTDIYSTKGDKVGTMQLPPVFETPFRHDLIHRIYTIQNTHSFQPKGTHPTAGMDVSADSLDPPTGHGQSRVARINAGGAGGRGGQGGEVASTKVEDKLLRSSNMPLDGYLLVETNILNCIYAVYEIMTERRLKYWW